MGALAKFFLCLLKIKNLKIVLTAIGVSLIHGPIPN